VSSYLIDDNRKGSGLKIDYIQTAAAIPAYSLVYINAAGLWDLADADAVASMPTLGIAPGAIGLGLRGEVLLIGSVGVNSWAWTPGGDMYVSQTAGALTQTAPGAGAVNQSIGVAIDATTIYFNPSGFASASGTFAGDVDIAGTLTVDTINEHTALTGVTIEGVLIDTNTITVPSLTATRVPYAGVGGLLSDEAGFEYVAGTDTLTVGNVADSALTATRVVFAGASGLLTDDADMTFVGDTLTVTKINTTEATLNFTQDYLFTEHSTNYLGIQGQTSGLPTTISIFSKDGDGSDNSYLQLFGVGTPNTVTNQEVLTLGYDQANTRYSFAATKGGTGTVRPIHLYTGAYTTQLVLNIDGTVSMSSLTSGRIPIAGASGLLGDDSDLTFSGDTLTATKIIGDTHIQTDLIIEKTADAGVTIDSVLLKDGDVLANGQVYGVEWNQSTDTWTQIDIDGATITPSTADFNSHEVWGNITRVNLASDGIINARYGDGDYAADGSNGEVMVEIPAFYVKGEQTTAQVYQWWISRVPLTGFEIHPAFLQRDGRPKAFIYVGAYEASLMVGTGVHDAVTTLKLHTRSAEQPWTGGEIDALPYDSGSTEFTRGETLTGATGGGTADVIDWTLTGGTWGGGDAAGTVYIKQNAVADFQAENLDGSVGGANMAGATGIQVAESLDIGEARTYGAAQGAGWGQMGIWSLSAVKLLFVVEYGNMDSQTEVGRGVVDLASGAGYAGLETAAASVDSNLDAAGTGVGTGADGDVPATYRYIENLWGNVWSFIDGYNAVDAEYRLIERSGLGTFADGLATYEESSMAPITTDGYISDIEWDRVMKYLFIASVTGGGAGTYIPDYQYSPDAGETNILLAGGYWSYGSAAGLGNLGSRYVASLSAHTVSARAEYAP